MRRNDDPGSNAPRVRMVRDAALALLLVVTGFGVPTLAAAAAAAATEAAAASSAASSAAAREGVAADADAAADAGSDGADGDTGRPAAGGAPETGQSARSDDVFVPSEEISEDLSVAFPTDI